MISVSILDDQDIVLKGVEQMLKDCPNIVLEGIYQNKRELLEGFARNLTDILLLDIRMPLEEGDAVATQLLKQYPKLKILVLSNYDTVHYTKKMLRTGVAGYLLKNADKESLVAAITAVYNGIQYIDPTIQSLLIRELSERKKQDKAIPSLTRREQEILALIVRQLSSQQIADQLFLSLRTVENHRYNLFQKLDVKNVAGLVARAYALGLVDHQE